MNRIINGSEATIGQFPFAAAIIWLGSPYPVCSAVLITADRAVSASSCGRKSSCMMLLAGDLCFACPGEKRSPTRQLVNITKVIHHPKAGEPPKVNFAHNVAVFFLDRPISISNIVNYIPIASLDLKDRSIGVVIGFGRNMKTMADSQDRRLRYSFVKIDKRKCGYKKHGVLCAFGRTANPYKRDTGGALISRRSPYECFGFLTWSNLNRKTSLYTSAAKNKKWILRTFRKFTRSGKAGISQLDVLWPTGLRFCTLVDLLIQMTICKVQLYLN